MIKKLILSTLLLTSMMQATLLAATLTTSKITYNTNEQVHVHFANMTAKHKDWIGIYPQGSNNDWVNVVGWKWTDDKANGDLVFGNGHLAVGDYEVRAFYNNSFHTEATKAFSVEGIEVHPTLTTNKATYATNEHIIVNFSNMTAKNNDWVAIYSEGANNTWGNVIAWKWTNDTANGNLNFNALPVGAYEVRAFYNNSYNLEASKKFKVEGDTGPDYILYDDMEHGLKAQWVKYAGSIPAQIINTGAQGSAHSFRARRWTGYYFDFGTPAKKLKFLNLDTRIGVASHVGNFGVLVKTKKGNRRIIFSSYMNHPGNDMSGLPPEKWDKPYLSAGGYQHNHPGPTDYYLATRYGNFIHYKINIDEKIKVLEPDNEVLSILLFTTAGGDFDNIALSAN